VQPQPRLVIRRRSPGGLADNGDKNWQRLQERARLSILERRWSCTHVQSRRSMWTPLNLWARLSLHWTVEPPRFPPGLKFRCHGCCEPTSCSRPAGFDHRTARGSPRGRIYASRRVTRAILRFQSLLPAVQYQTFDPFMIHAKIINVFRPLINRYICRITSDKGLSRSILQPTSARNFNRTSINSNYYRAPLPFNSETGAYALLW
jgi:hypothetical protein